MKTSIKQTILSTLSTILLLSMVIVAQVNTAHAELIDQTNNKTISAVGSDIINKTKNSEQLFNFSASKARWIKKPTVKVNQCLIKRVKAGRILRPKIRMIINEQGDITSARIIKSTGHRCGDISLLRQVRQAKLLPFTKDGVPVKGYVDVPLIIKIP